MAPPLDHFIVQVLRFFIELLACIMILLVIPQILLLPLRSDPIPISATQLLLSLISNLLSRLSGPIRNSSCLFGIVVLFMQAFSSSPSPSITSSLTSSDAF
jgi:hypothetical protein